MVGLPQVVDPIEDLELGEALSSTNRKAASGDDVRTEQCLQAQAKYSIMDTVNQCWNQNSNAVILDKSCASPYF